MKAGVHFGHTTSRWHPKMEPFIFTVRNNIHVIDLEKTIAYLEKALSFLAEQAALGEQTLWLATKVQAKALVERSAKECESPYVVEKWIGGTFTNFPTIQKLIGRLEKLEKHKKEGVLDKYTKREQLEFQREIDRLDRLVGGIRTMKSLPGAVCIFDIREEKTALREAKKKGIPVVAVVDTNVDPTVVDYPIPGNDDAVKSIELFARLFAEAINEGRKKAASADHEKAKKETATPTDGAR